MTNDIDLREKSISGHEWSCEVTKLTDQRELLLGQGGGFGHPLS
jgi:hypothetical protein